MRKSLTIILTSAFLLLATILKAQTTGDYRSTLTGGNWNGTTTWETWNGSSWSSTSTPPGSSTPNVAILGNVTIPSGVSADASMTTIASGVTLTVANGATLSIGPSKIISGAGSFSLQAGGTLKIGHASGINKLPSNTGNIQASGSRTYSSGAYYHYVGTAAQITGNGLPSDSVRGLVINNSKGVTVTDSVKVSVSLRLTKGKLFTSTGHEITLLATGTLIGGDNGSFVQGPYRQAIVSKLQVTCIYPVGDNRGYRPVTQVIKHNKDLLCIYQVEMFSPTAYNNSFKSGVYWVDPNRYWKLTPIAKNAAINNATYTLIWTKADSVTEVNKMIVAALDASNSWSKISGSPTLVGTTDTGSITFADNDQRVNNYVLASNSPLNPLPVELVSFSVALQGEAAHLSWITASEIDNDRFEVERSLDGKHFEVIGIVRGHGNAQVPINYAYVDATISRMRSKVVYYRLKQVDFNGAFAYSSMKTIRLNGSDAATGVISLYPNPGNAERLVMRRSHESAAGNAIVEIFNASGKRVHTQGLQWNGLESSLHPPKLPTGIYHVKVSEAAGQHHVRLIMK